MPINQCLNCVLNPWIGCKACNWKLCNPCRQDIGYPWVNRAIHREASPECKEALDVNTNYNDWPSFFSNSYNNGK